ncbi:MAG: response regulator transcription factor [Bdellovibrio sp.]|nr:response regulator transcription factor [Bdellovibrio sp.]
MNKVLLVEDSEEFQVVVKHALADSDVNLSIAGSYEELQSLIVASGAEFDLAILDLVLPDSDGFEVLKKLRLAGMKVDTPVFFLTSQNEVSAKVTAFNLGADDYLVKPISPIELRARVEMRLRKGKAVFNEVITKGDLVIDLVVLRACRLVNQQQIDLSLTSKEFKIVTFLVQNENRIFSRAELVEAVWGVGVHVQDRTVDSHVHGLRKKMGPMFNYVECIYGEGYKFALPTAAEAAGKRFN